MARNHRGDSPDAGELGDDDIRGLVLDELRQQPNLDADLIDVRVQDGRVTLAGRVGTDAEIKVAGNIVSDVIGAAELSNELVIDETQRGERAAGADEAAMEGDELESQVDGYTGEQTDTAEHLQENLQDEQWGTHDMHSAIRDGTSYTPPDHPTPDGYDSREEH